MTRRRLAAVPDQPQRVVLYARVSALMGRGGDDFHSPEVQTTAMRRLTAGMREVDVIEDIDQTGRTFSRDGVDKIRKLAEAGAIDAVAVYNVSRFGRNVLESLQFLAWLAERGVTILSASEHIDTSTPSGRWMLVNMLAIAEMRSDEIGAEWAATIHARAKAGKPHGPAPTGYRRGDTGRLEIDPVVGPAIMQAFAAYAAGVEVRPIRRALQAATGLRMVTSTLKKMLRNRAYLGVVAVRGGGTGTVETPDAHAALVDADTWEKVQERLARDYRQPARLSEPKYPLSGIGRCGSCGHPTNHRPRPARGKRGPWVAIHCRRQQDQLGDRCLGCGLPPAVQVEAAVLDEIRAYIELLRYDVGARAARMARAQRAGIDAGASRRELKEVRAAMTRAAEGWARGRMDDRTYDETAAGLRAAEAALVESLGRLDEAAQLPEPGKVIALAERLLELWQRPEMTGAQRNRALRGLVRTVTIWPSTYYRQPVKERIRVDWI